MESMRELALGLASLCFVLEPLLERALGCFVLELAFGCFGFGVTSTTASLMDSAFAKGTLGTLAAFGVGAFRGLDLLVSSGTDGVDGALLSCSFNSFSRPAPRRSFRASSLSNSLPAAKIPAQCPRSQWAKSSNNTDGSSSELVI